MTTKTIPLAYPVEHEGTTITEVTLRRAKTKDLRLIDAAGGNDLDQGVAMVAAISGLPVAAVDEMDAEDFATISEALADFFPAVKVPGSGGK